MTLAPFTQHIQYIVVVHCHQKFYRMIPLVLMSLQDDQSTDEILEYRVVTIEALEIVTPNYVHLE